MLPLRGDGAASIQNDADDDDKQKAEQHFHESHQMQAT